MSVPSFAKSIANDAPGFTSITFSTDAAVTVTNTTSGRSNPEPYHWRPLALYPSGSPVCTLGKDLMLNPDQPALSSIALPRFTTSDGGPSKFCALDLTADMSFGPSAYRASPAPLGVGESQQLTVAPGSTVTFPGTIPHVPEGSVDKLIAGLAKPAKIVYAVTYPQYGMAEGDQKPAGETCNGYFYADSTSTVQSNPFVIAVPAKYAGVCS